MSGCFHCGEPLPPRPVAAFLAGEARAFCCAGCAAAAEFIEALGAGRYYAVRTAAAPRAGEAPALDAWDVDAALAGHVAVHGDVREIVVALEGVRCAACAWLVERVLAGTAAVASAEVNPATARLRLEWRPSEAKLSEVFAPLVALGYVPCLPSLGDAAGRAERRTALKRLAVAGLGAMQSMMFAEALYFGDGGGMAIETREFFRVVGLVVSTPVVFYAGWPFLRGAVAELSLRRPGMDVLVASTVLLAWLASVIETVRGGPVVYFDAAVMFVFLLLATRELEATARRRAGAALAVLARSRPARARRIAADGIEDVAVAALRAGDRVRVAVGEAVPADGFVRGARGWVSEAVLTGEPRALVREPGERVLAGSICIERPFELEVSATGGDTALAQVARLAERAAAQRPRAARVAEAVASRVVVALVAVCALVAIAWWFVDPSRIVPVTLAVLAVTCPCALSLAVPAAHAAAQSALTQRGVLVLDPDALERLATIDTIAFDKTGTLTEGRARLLAVDAPEIGAPRALAIAAALERDIVHPAAAALRAAASGAGLLAGDVEAKPGQGVSGSVEGVRYRIGAAAWAGGATGEPRIVLAGPDGPLAWFTIDDRLREDARSAVASFRGAGVETRLWSGDASARVASVAEACGVEVAEGALSPDGKLARLVAERARGRRVAMVGDGVNDAPVLAGADVSFALGDGSALAHASAGFVVVGARLGAAAAAHRIARRTRRIVRQNLAWALAYNTLALPFAALGFAPPWLAAVGMSLSSLVVTANALRLARPPTDERTAATPSGSAAAPRATLAEVAT